MSVSVTLRQEKTILVDDYRVVSRVTAASPSGMYPLFVIKQGDYFSPWDEVCERVATLDDLANYTENPLVRLITDITTHAPTAQVGDTLIMQPPSSSKWLDTYLTDLKFTVTVVDGAYLEVDSAKPFPFAENNLGWVLKDPTEVTTRGSNTGDWVQRTDEGVAVWLRRHFSAFFADVSRAESHVTATQTWVQSIVNAANVHGITFEGEEEETYE